MSKEPCYFCSKWGWCPVCSVDCNIDGHEWNDKGRCDVCGTDHETPSDEWLGRVRSSHMEDEE